MALGQLAILGRAPRGLQALGLGVDAATVSTAPRGSRREAGTGVWLGISETGIGVRAQLPSAV